MEDLFLKGYDSKVEPSEYLLVLDKEVTYQNTLPEFRPSSIPITNEIEELREDNINSLKQTIEIKRAQN